MNTVPLYTINNNGSRDFSITFEDVMGGNYTVGVMNDHLFNTYIFDVTFEMKVPNFIISEDEVYENLTDAPSSGTLSGVGVAFSSCSTVISSWPLLMLILKSLARAFTGNIVKDL